MSLIKNGVSALGKLLIVVALAGTFLVGLASVIYMSLQGNAIKVPEITGKDFTESEKELTALGLKIKKRADRYSTEKVNTILEQLPKAGDTVKTGQMILVVTSKINPDGNEAPTDLKKINEEQKDDSNSIIDLISDSPKKNNKQNTNSAPTKKKPDTKRDSGDSGNSKPNSNSVSNSATISNSTAPASGKDGKTTPTVSNKAAPPATPVKPNAEKTPSGGDVRPRVTPKP